MEVSQAVYTRGTRLLRLDLMLEQFQSSTWLKARGGVHSCLCLD